MNNILHLKGQFEQNKNPSRPGAPNLPVGKFVKADHLDDLKHQLSSISDYWKKDVKLGGALVSVYYNHVVAKSNRMKGLLCKGRSDPSDTICGAKFSGEDPVQHVFTHFVHLDVLRESIRRLEMCSTIVRTEFNGVISHENISQINDKKRAYQHKELAKTNFLNVVVDAYYIEHFTIDRDESPNKETSIVTIYKTAKRTTDLLRSLGIDMIDAKVLDETTVRLDPDELGLLKQKAPYLIAMKTHDLSKMLPDDIIESNTSIVQIPPPNQEPIVGVIDTLFYEDVYFSKWVDYIRMVDENIETTSKDCIHGTEVTSLIVDGPAINPNLDDGCGRFRVRHFGVAVQGRFSAFTVLKSIREVVAKNREVKVWNLSLGSVLEINRNFISPEAAELDRIQSEYDVVFVVAGTNKPSDISESMLIGAPADSLNSIVVNAVDYQGNPATYHRTGPVLSFFNKPDVSYYGGDVNQKMRVCTPFGEGLVSGTSFAAPWISRKMAYLIHAMGLSREVAKALLIDSAAGWNRQDDTSHAIGYGVVPQRIEEIVQTQDGEIRFILTGSADSYEVSTYRLPIPIYKDKQPFFARATLCYFPRCSRSQGVDYTSTEMDLHFGRVKEVAGRTSAIVAINTNKQGDEGFHLIREENARKLYRKWDNVKFVSDVIKERSRARQVLSTNGMWGLSIKTKERLRPRNGKGLQFGVVVTLKEMNGNNRIDDFIKLCMVRGWIVNQIDIENRFDVYAKAEEELDFD